MPWVNRELPFAASEHQTAAHCSHAGAKAAAPKAGTQTLQLLELYARRGPSTDMEAAVALNWQRSTVNARRGALCARGVVVAKGTKPGIAGVKNTVWGLA